MDAGIGSGKARPDSGVAQLGPGQAPKGIAPMDLYGGCRAVRGRAGYAGCDRCARGNDRKRETSAGQDAIGVRYPGIGGAQFVPAAPVAQINQSQLPEGVARPDADRPLAGDDCGWKSVSRLQRTNRCGRRDGLRRQNKRCRLRVERKTGRRGSREYFWLRRNDQARARTNVGADNLIKVGTNFRLNCRPDFVTNFATNFFTNFGTRRGPNIFRGRLNAMSGASRDVRTNRSRGKRIAQKNLRGNFLMDDGLNRRTDRGTLRQNRRRERGSREGKMERSRLFRFQGLQFFLLAILACDLAERSSVRSRIRIEARRRILRRRGRAIFFLRAFVPFRFGYGAVFGSENVSAREIVVGVDMSGRFLFFVLASACLTSGIGDALGLLVLRARNGRAEGNAAQKCGKRDGDGGGKRDSPRARASRLER